MTKVQSLAQSGHAFEQNQLGIASMLVVGPELDAKEALAWFERAAQRGYPPARAPTTTGATCHDQDCIVGAGNEFGEGIVRAHYDETMLFANLKRVFGKDRTLGDESLQTGLLIVTKRGRPCQHVQ